MVPVALLILTIPFTMFLSPFIAIISHSSLSRDCNEVTTAKIIKINRLDAMQCNIEAYLYAYNTNMTLPPMPCKDLSPCRIIRNNLNNIDRINECTNITISMNHWYRDRACVRIIMSESMRPTIDYHDTYAWFIKGIIETCFLVAFVAHFRFA